MDNKISGYKNDMRDMSRVMKYQISSRGNFRHRARKDLTEKMILTGGLKIRSKELDI